MSAAMHGKTVGASVCAQRVFTLWMIRLEGTAHASNFCGWIAGTV
jgi:hypothetical protein